MKKMKRDSTIFGYELFAETSTVFEPNFKIATPASYTLGPGDEVVIQVFGYSEQTYNLTVNAEGSIYIPNVGPVQVSGLTMEDASGRIRSKLASTIYKAIRSGQTRVQVSLGKMRTISVSVIGQAGKPGTYSVSSLTTLFNMLYLCGGPSDQGSFRKIELIRGNKVFRSVDLYGFLLRGDRMDNVLLRDQDIIRIPYYETRVMVSGEVKRPGQFEMNGDENLDQLLTFCGGFSDSAYRGLVKAVRVSDQGRQLVDITQGQFGSFIPRPGDHLVVSKAINRYLNRVRLDGAVFRPGEFELKPGMQLKDLLDLAGGLKQDAYVERGFIARLNADLTPTSLSFNVRDVLAGTEKIELQREDFITISSLFDLRDSFAVEVLGDIRKPGKFLYRQNLQLKDVLIQAGGFAESADLSSIEISRKVLVADITASEYQQAEIIKVDMSNGLNSAEGNQPLAPGDVVVVRPKGTYTNQRRVSAIGELVNPGQFVLQSSRERISTLVARAGGFKSTADSSSITIKRIVAKGISESEKQRMAQRLLRINRDSLNNNPELREAYFSSIDFLSVNVAKIKESPGGTEDVLLEDGDVIEVARASNLVRVSGEVYHPGLLPYEGKSNAKYYINRSGSFTSNARRSRTFVVYPDGRAKSVNKFLFFKSYPTVTSRSEIYVPSKDKEGKKSLSTGEWIAISSIMATLATMTITIVEALK
jgi:protein involved in polysaccharide export with SLBB domain